MNCKTLFACYLVMTWDPADAYNGKDYSSSDFLTNWQGSKTICEANDAIQAVISSEEDDTFIRQRFTNPTSQ